MTEGWTSWWDNHYTGYIAGAQLLGMTPLAWPDYQRERDAGNPDVEAAEQAAQIVSTLDCVPGRGYPQPVWWHPVAGDPPPPPALAVRIAVGGGPEQCPVFERWLRAGWTVIWLAGDCPAAAALAAEFAGQWWYRELHPQSLRRVLTGLQSDLRKLESDSAAMDAAELRTKHAGVQRNLDVYEEAVRHRAIQLGHDPRAGRFTHPLSDVEVAEVRGWDKPRADYLRELTELAGQLSAAESRHQRAQGDLLALRKQIGPALEPHAARGAVTPADAARYAADETADEALRKIAELRKGLADQGGREAVRWRSVPGYLRRRLDWISAVQQQIDQHQAKLDSEALLAWLSTQPGTQLNCTVKNGKAFALLTWRGAPLLAEFDTAERRLAQALKSLRDGAELDDVCAHLVNVD